MYFSGYRARTIVCTANEVCTGKKERWTHQWWIQSYTLLRISKGKVIVYQIIVVSY